MIGCVFRWVAGRVNHRNTVINSFILTDQLSVLVAAAAYFHSGNISGHFCGNAKTGKATEANAGTLHHQVHMVILVAVTGLGGSRLTSVGIHFILSHSSHPSREIIPSIHYDKILFLVTSPTVN